MATWKRLRARKAAKDSPKTMAILELCRTAKGKTPHVLSSIWAGFSMQLFITCLNGRTIVTAFTSSKEKISSHGLPPETSSKTAGLLMPLSYSHVSRCPHPEPPCLQNKKPQPDSYLLLFPCSQSTSSTVLTHTQHSLHILYVFVRTFSCCGCRCLSFLLLLLFGWVFFLCLVVCLGEIVFV